MPLTDIIVLSYRDSQSLSRCVTSIQATCTDYNLILVDNNVFNRGFSAGCNFGAKQSNSKFILLLNSDAYIQPGCLQALLDRAKESKVGIVGAKQVDPLEPNRITFGGVIGSPYPYGRHKGGSVKMGNCDIPSRQIWLNGAAMIVKRSLWEHLKGMDERLFMFYSDSDFSLRAKTSGAELWYEPSAVVYHKLQSSASGNKYLNEDKKVFEDIWGLNNPLYTTL